MEADWTRLQPPDQTTPAHPKVASPSRHNKKAKLYEDTKTHAFCASLANRGLQSRQRIYAAWAE